MKTVFYLRSYGDFKDVLYKYDGKAVLFYMNIFPKKWEASVHSDIRSMESISDVLKEIPASEACFYL